VYVLGGKVPQAIDNDVVHRTKAAGPGRHAGFEILRNICERPRAETIRGLRQIDGRPTAEFIVRHFLLKASTGVSLRGDFRQQKISRRVTRAAMTRALHQVCPAIPFLRARMIFLKSAGSEKQIIPNKKAPALPE